MVVYLLIFFIVAMPGIYLGEILIHFTDIYIFILFLYFFKWKLKTNIIQIWLFFYILAIISSIIVASFTSNIGISPVLKTVRIILACMIYPIVLKCHNYFVSEKCTKFVLIAGIISSLIGVYLFFLQSQLYRAPHTMLLGGKLMYRAGGVFAEPTTFSLIMSFIFSISLEYILDKKMLVLSVTAMAMSLFSIILSDTRVAVLAIMVVTVISLSRRGIFKTKQLFLCLLFFMFLIGFYLSSDLFQRFVNDRLLVTFNSLFEQGSASINDVSSGRLKIWEDRLTAYCSSTLDVILFGTGYKVGDVDNFLADNNYISVLCCCGLFGAIAFIGYWLSHIQFLLKLKRTYRRDISFRVFSNMLLIFLIFMLTCDAMTMARPLYLFSLYSSITYLWVKNLKAPKLEIEYQRINKKQIEGRYCG